MAPVRQDDSLRPPADIDRPFIIVNKNDEGGEGYLVDITRLDPLGNEPRRFGVILSDLIDHIAFAYSGILARDQCDIRAHIVKVMRDEDRFKEKDPTRGKMSGTTITPSKN